MQELFSSEDGLVSEQVWHNRITDLRQRTIGEGSLQTVRETLVKAVRQRLPEDPHQVGLLLSGGVDSSTLALLLAQEGAVPHCYCVGIEGAPDLDWAPRVAKALHLPLTIKTLTLDDLQVLLKRLAHILPLDRLSDENLAVLFGVAAVELCAIDLALHDQITDLFGGLGSEEIFAGYRRHERSRDINEECWNGLLGMHRRDLIRDCSVAAATRVNLHTPFLDADLIVEAMKLQGGDKIKGDIKKYPLRQIAEALGLPKEVAWRKKKAAQYGSRIDHAIEKLAKRQGFGAKREYLLCLSKQ